MLTARRFIAEYQRKSVNDGFDLGTAGYVALPHWLMRHSVFPGVLALFRLIDAPARGPQSGSLSLFFSIFAILSVAIDNTTWVCLTLAVALIAASGYSTWRVLALADKVKQAIRDSAPRGPG